MHREMPSSAMHSGYPIPIRSDHRECRIASPFSVCPRVEVPPPPSSVLGATMTLSVDASISHFGSPEVPPFRLGRCLL